ncbi:MAG: periplasmic sensor signal transduction histidine kinase [Acidimicrobiaceae bacterium]|nr:periplasmic sensor signal transduction histidine kinase [Acidimicrobiaceae bacterium]
MPMRWPRLRRRSGDGLPPTRGLQRPHHFHLGLRARITLTFGFGAFVLSGALAAVTYYTTRQQILSHIESSYATTFTSNAEQIKAELTVVSPLTTPDARVAIVNFLSSLDGNSNVASVSRSLVYLNGLPDSQQPWITDGLIGSDLQSAAPSIVYDTTGTAFGAAQQVAQVDGWPQIIFAVPFSNVNATYFEVFNLRQTAETLRVILASLVAAALATTILGAVLGRWASGRALRPLRDVSRVALAIASGQLDARLDTGNLSDLAVLGASFNRMADRLQQRIERDARFTSDVSHELRSPLTTLATSLSVIEARRAELPDRVAQALDLLSAEIRRFQRMVDSLLEISRYDAGSVDFRQDVVAVGELVRRALRSADALGVPVICPPALAEQTIVVDKRRFERIVANLVENARRYAGGLTRIVVAERAGALRLSFEDEGPGVPAAERERIFERFARGSLAAGSRGTGEGTGLGLALVTEHVKLHGGQIWVEERLGGGARFIVELPIGTETEIHEAFDQDAPQQDGGGLEHGAGAPASTTR